ncbi:MAG: Winged helix DNA-binding protein [Nocardioidaceae bacterium]|nr:Winged helix DNA-binding protein [Nocardioidaceae bacterium]
MHVGEVSLRRMRSVRLGGPSGLERPEDVVRWFGALQAQDVSPARWSVGQRLGSGTTEDVVQRACDEGRILRTHVLRPTWHFVCPEDLRWLQALTGPRVQAGMATALRTAGLIPDVLLRCHDLIGVALTGGVSLTRPELAEVLARGGVEVSGNPLALVMLHTELEALVCSGGQRGKQQTYALVDERVPFVQPLDRDDALVELVTRFFTGHGPATAKDLRWWSSLTLADIALGLEGAGDRLREDVVDGVTYWSAPDAEPWRPPSPAYRFLQTFDEYVVGYTESRYAFDLSGRARALPGDTLLRNGAVLLDGQVAGHWRRTVRAEQVVVETRLYDEPDREALQVAADELGAFLGRTAVVDWSLV